MTKLFFIRHGKTQWNLASRYQGMHGDSPLLPGSYQEIKLLSKYLNQFSFGHMYASPIKRARDTANYLRAQLNQKVPLTLVSGIAEFDLGKMEGMAFDEVAQLYPAEFDAFRNHPERYQPQQIQGESFPQVISRFKRAVDEMVVNHPDENIIVVTHGAAMNAGINGLLAVPLDRLRERGGLSNTSTTILESQRPEDGYHLVSWNDTSYLNRTENDPTDTI